MMPKLSHGVVDERIEIEGIEEGLTIGFDLLSGLARRLTVETLLQVIRVKIAVGTERNPDRAERRTEVPFLSKVVSPIERWIQFSGCRAIAAFRASLTHLSGSSGLGVPAFDNKRGGCA